MNKELEKKLIEDLVKSGFSSELQAIHTFQAANWNCTGFASYVDYDLNDEKLRSVDLRASILKKDSPPTINPVEIDFVVDAEVKKSEKPWIIFKETNVILADDHRTNLVYLYNVKNPYRLSTPSRQGSLYSECKWIGHGIHESFKKPDEFSRSYQAILNVCKSAEHTLKQYSAVYREESQLGDSADDPFGTAIVFVKPLVILDGQLITATLNATGEISLEEVAFAPLLFFHKSKSCHKSSYLVDLVTLSGLKDYLPFLDRRIESIFSAMKELGNRKP